MKTYLLCFLFLLLSSGGLWSQDNGLPYWDYRSNRTINVLFGLGYDFDQQNAGWYPFVDVEYAPLRDAFRQNQGKDQYYSWSGDLRLHATFRIRRDLKKFGWSNDRREGRVSWTYDSNFAIMGDFLLRKISAYYNDQENTRVPGSVLRISYSMHDSGIRGQLRKLANTNGRLTIGLRSVTDHWNFQIYLQNDFWIWLLKRDIIKHDHGNTTEFGVQAHFRPRAPFFETSFLELEHNNMLHAHYWFQIITDRKVANTTSVAFARLGYYDVSDQDYNNFHGYNRFSVGFRSSLFNLELGGMIDNLVMGRNLQRWAHQGTTHRNLKRRVNILGLAKNYLFNSELKFTKDRLKSKRIYLIHDFWSTDKRHDLLKSVRHIKQLSRKEIKDIYAQDKQLQLEYQQQLFINKYRYKKSRTMEPTALFPWEANSNFYKPKAKSFYLRAEVFEQN